MVVLYKNINNNVVMTLDENATQALHDYLIEFTNDTTGEKTYYTPVDISPAPNRYNEFVISGEGLTGFSSYTAYEMPVTSPRSTDPSIALAICETGKVLIIDPNENPVSEFTTDENKSNAVFDA